MPEGVFDCPASEAAAQISPPRPSDLERNAHKLSALEQERSSLGPLRRITFTTRFLKEHFAEDFASLLNQKDWRIDVINRGSAYEWFVTATRLMEPNTENVTNCERFFLTHPVVTQPHHTGGAYYHGWKYHDKQDVSFSPSEYFDMETFASDRADVLFGIALAQDRLNGHKWTTRPAARAPAFKLHPGEFIRSARARRPSNPHPTASAFSQWLYSLYSNVHGSAEDRQDGRDAERAIMDARLQAYSSIDSDCVRRDYPEWSLVHNGLHLQDERRPGYHEIATLPVAGQPLRASPDLVFRNARTGELIIVEIKHSRMLIPENLWPNVWGQLWCYAQVDMARDAPKVTVVGEVWGDGWAKHSSRLVCLRASVRRDPRASAYDRFFRTLFDIYRGGL
ncbi:hypothetical protein [Sphingomonas sp.]|uniref:hypothetical protein n=1 Tax=Sphingomonas sp. TaxID=28214 RepID=UPI003B0031D0